MTRIPTHRVFFFCSPGLEVKLHVFDLVFGKAVVTPLSAAELCTPVNPFYEQDTAEYLEGRPGSALLAAMLWYVIDSFSQHYALDESP